MLGLRNALLVGTAAVAFAATPAHTDTFVVQGYVANPTGPDSNPSVYGYDNGGFFGPQFANLGGLPFTVTWTGTDCECYFPIVPPLPSSPVSPITGATLTINGQALNL